MTGIKRLKKVPTAMRAYFDPSPIPKKIIKRGIHAIAGTGNSIMKVRSNKDENNFDTDKIEPTAIPKPAPIENPIISRFRLASVCSKSVRFSRSLNSVFKTSEGGANIDAGQ